MIRANEKGPAQGRAQFGTKGRDPLASMTDEKTMTDTAPKIKARERYDQRRAA